MTQWVGYMVSIKCIDNMGTYQGEIVSATNSDIVLTKAFCNGFPCERTEVIIKWVVMFYTTFLKIPGCTDFDMFFETTT